MALKTPGSVWLTPYEGKLWPAVLCDDKLPPRDFMSTRANSYAHPAILLGKRIYKWVALNHLTQLDPGKNYIDGEEFENNDIHESDTAQEKLKKQRRIAFTIDAKDPQTPEYYKNFIEQRSATRRIEREKSTKVHNRKRSREADDEVEFVGVRRKCSPTSAGWSRKAQYGGARESQLPSPDSHKKKQKRSTNSNDDEEDSGEDAFVRQSNDLDDPFTMTAEELRQTNWNAVRKNPPTDDMCTVFVGPEQTPFLVPTKRVGECDFLSDLVCFTEEMRSHINLEHDTDVNAKEFVEVWDYIGKGDFAPRLIESKLRAECLERVVLQEEKDVAATKIARVYITAAKIRFGALQQLCLDKLKTIYPLSSHALLTVLMVFTKADVYLTAADVDQEGREWLIDHVVEQFWTLVKNENMTFARLMSRHCELTHSILAKLGQNPKMAHGTD